MLCCFGPNLRLHCPLSLHINPCLVTVSAIYWARGASMVASHWSPASNTGLWLADDDWAPDTMQFRVPLHWTFGARPLCCKVRRNQSMPSWKLEIFYRTDKIPRTLDTLKWGWIEMLFCSKLMSWHPVFIPGCTFYPWICGPRVSWPSVLLHLCQAMLLVR